MIGTTKKPLLGVLFCVVVATSLLQCSEPAESVEPAVGLAAVGSHDEGDGELELAVLMGEMQRHGAKLGYAIAAQNQPLSEFYLEEVEEIVAELMEIERHDDIEISTAITPIIPALLEPLRQSITAADWTASSTSYSALLDGCNRCHAATEHEFIVVLEPVGPPPYNQAFETDPE